MRALLIIASLSAPAPHASYESWRHGRNVCGSSLEALAWERTGVCSRAFLGEFIWRAA